MNWNVNFSFFASYVPLTLFCFLPIKTSAKKRIHRSQKRGHRPYGDWMDLSSIRLSTELPNQMRTSAVHSLSDMKDISMKPRSSIDGSYLFVYIVSQLTCPSNKTFSVAVDMLHAYPSRPAAQVGKVTRAPLDVWGGLMMTVGACCYKLAELP